MSAGQKVAAALISGLVIVLTAWLSQLPTSQAGPEDALIRLSWRLEGIAVEDCRTLSAEELAEIPAHMRRPEECSRQIVDYELRVDLGTSTVLVDTVAPAGARRDRPLYVFHDLPTQPGEHDVRVRFEALVPDGFESTERPVLYTYGDRISLGERDIALITLVEDEDTLRRLLPGA